MNLIVRVARARLGKVEDSRTGPERASRGGQRRACWHAEETVRTSAYRAARSSRRPLTAFDIVADGGLSNRRVWTDLDGGAPDGICLDAENAVWYGDVPNKRCVRVREGGEMLQTVDLDRGCFACALGGADKRTLFLMANEWRGTANMADGSRTGQVLTVEAPAPGAGWP
jgi:sugar lactone lactonase YvrE